MSSHVQNIKGISADDYKLIREEHERLDRFLQDLRDTCCNLDNQLDCNSCSREKFASCHGRMYSFLYDLLDITDKHFYNEESIMLSRPHISEEYEYFRLHRQAHFNIMRSLKSIVDDCASLDERGITAEGYRQLYEKISTLFEEHGRLFDDPFIQSVSLQK